MRRHDWRALKESVGKSILEKTRVAAGGRWHFSDVEERYFSVSAKLPVTGIHYSYVVYHVSLL
jgi:hypothetical protein